LILAEEKRESETANKNKGFKFAYGEQTARSEVLAAVLLVVSKLYDTRF
jgi:hypothetical protein